MGFRESKKGSKLILSDHGFYLEDEIDFNLWKKIAYKYVKWNLTKKKTVINCLLIFYLVEKN